MATFQGDARDAKRARQGARQQEEMKEAFERKVQELRRETEKSVQNMGLHQMFSHEENVSEQRFRDAIVGLQSNEEYLHKQRLILEQEEHEAEEKKVKKKKKKRKLEPKLSFAFHDDDEDEDDDDLDVMEDVRRGTDPHADEDDDEDDEPPLKKSRKNPSVDTSFLPDPERDAADEALRKQLEQEWKDRQRNIKKGRLEITYSYWDGSGHRRTIEITKGMKILEFLELVRKELSVHFSELRGLNGHSLMYIKDDLIIPHNYSFYDLVVTGAKGQSNNLMFRSEEYDKGEYTIDRDIGHPGKVITRSWYERNKHIFPASRWEVYDPAMHTKKGL